jgi:hypothetical protein
MCRVRETAVEKKANCMHNGEKVDAFFEWKLLAFSWLAYFAKSTIVLPDWLSDRAWLSFIATAPRRDFVPRLNRSPPGLILAQGRESAFAAFASTEHHN